MKKILLLVAFVATGLLANAQGGAMKQEAAPGGRPDANTRATNITERMTQALTLTDAEKPKVMAINLEKAKAMDANQVKNGKDQKAFEAEKTKVTLKWDTDLKGVLTAEQYTKFEKMQADQASKEKPKPAAVPAK